MKVGLMGFGKTGKAVANVLLQHPDIKVCWVYRQSHLLENRTVAEFLGIATENNAPVLSAQTISPKQLFEQYPVDIVIDFSDASALEQYGEAAAVHGVKIISAISHYQPQQINLLHQLAEKTTVFWSPNITIGVNYLIFAAKFLQKIAPWVDVVINEEHFRAKPGISGTAVKIAEALAVNPTEINSTRAGGIVGKHEVVFGFPYQTVRLVHESISREAFGNGAIFVAQNINNKPNGFYNFEAILLPYFAA